MFCFGKWIPYVIRVNIYNLTVSVHLFDVPLSSYSFLFLVSY